MRTLILSLLLFTVSSCNKHNLNPKNYNYEIPQSISDGVPIRDINTYNLDEDLIDNEINNVHSVLIYKDDALFYEKYLCGKDEKHGKNLGKIKHSIYTLHDTRSVSKSVVSSCIGIAIKKGLIQNENESIKNYFPCLENNEKGEITIKDLLTMSSGFCWHEIGNYNGLNDETKMDLNNDPISFVLKKDLITPPSLLWNYCGGNTQLLAEIIVKVSGQNICEFASENLFNPLLIDNMEWTKLKVKKIPAAASGLRLTSRSLLKFGMLYLNKGMFNNEQILDSNWVNKSLSNLIQRPDFSSLNLENGAYGYQFWTYEFNINNTTVNIVEAKGNGGQSIFLCRELNLVVVITAGNYGKSKYNKIPYQILKEYILKAIL